MKHTIFPHNQWLTDLLTELSLLPPLLLSLNNQGEGLRFGEVVGKALELGVDVEENRPYQLGDPARLINWRLTARSHQVFVKYQPKPSELRARLLVDLRASLWQGTHIRLKAEQVVRIAFRIAQALSQSVIVDTQVWATEPESLPVLRGQARWNLWTESFYSTVVGLSSLAKIVHEAPLSDALTLSHSLNQWVVIVSDFVDWDDKLESALLDAQAIGQVLLIHVLDRQEMVLSEDIGILVGEMGFHIDDGRYQTYQSAMRDYLDHISKWCADVGVMYWRCLASDPLASVMSSDYTVHETAST